ncbi:MAG TPA: hypothetical protein VMM27_04330 [Casimicrobiaceae bacterium]|nr:hypothetical protein [Casimicrobiaceae bacterium]
MRIERLTQKARHELIEYAFNVAYLTFVFAAFTQYRRFLLAEYNIIYSNYWLALIGALILGKVVMIGSVFRLGRWLEDKPLIVPTIYKTLVFWIFVVVLRVVEYAIKGVLHGDGLAAALDEFFAQKGIDEVLANSLAVLIALLPFFAVKELGRVLGRERIAALFFRKGIER